MKQFGLVLATALFIPLLVSFLIKALGAVYGVLSKVLLFLLWIVTVVAGGLLLLHGWNRRGADRSRKSAGSR